MLDIRPVSELRNNFADIEAAVKNGHPVYLTKNGYGSMVVMSIEQYSALTDDIERKLDETDEYAEKHSERLTHDQVFGKVRAYKNNK
ncbi:MAG: type II toxin-antitoxin system Phd/YefM family antitoxin [Ruminiclostridium sp.]|nr:type II toxin-antitoxin system Phd/YefM family antitoxin [Ruminiclostridium sp.]